MSKEQTIKYKVLLVDDEKFVRFTLLQFFRQTEYDVTAVSSPQEALELMHRESFEVVVSDVMMEPINGFMFRQLLRERYPVIPIIFLTGLVNNMDNALLTQVMDDPFSYYVPKNTNKQFLLAKLGQVLQYSQAEKTIKRIEAQVQENQELASEVQNAFLPPWTRQEDKYQFSWLYKPLGKISGDLFEWIPLNDHSVLAVFGDVAGHGTHSAMGMMAIQSFLKQMALYTEENVMYPHKIAKDINDFILQYLSGRVYMCGLILYWNLETNVMRMHNAGYLDIISFDIHSGKRKDLNPDHLGSVPLGMMKGSEYLEKNTVEYIGNDNEVYLVASDGLLDLSRTEEGDEPVDHAMLNDLMSILVQNVTTEDNVVALPYKCYDTLEQLGYNYPQDDVSLIVLRKKVANPDDKVFVSRVNLNIDDVDKVCMKAADFLIDMDLSVEFSTKVELLLEEHLVNIIEHGMKETKNQNDFIMLRMDCHESELLLKVWDRGREWKSKILDNGGPTPDGVLDILNSRHSASGRGVLIMRKIAPKITHERHCGLNETTFHIPYGEDSQGEGAKQEQ